MRIDAPQREQLPALRRLWKEAFGDSDEYLDRFARTAYSPARARCVTVDGMPVAALYWFDCYYGERRLAYLYAVATAEAYRGRGLCRALLEDTHRHLKETGYAGALLSPASDSLFHFYARVGYQNCTAVREITCDAAAEAVALRRLDREEYRDLRRQMLPPGGVLQEGETIRYLETFSAFYAGADFLLVAAEEDGQLFSAELLGNASAAPQIVRALGYEKGRFRMPGDEEFMTMYYPLDGGEAPSYFGLVLD